MSADSRPGGKHWYSPIEAPLVVDGPNDVAWIDEADAIVVGMGGSGMSASLEMDARGLSVIAVDRFDDGGATGMCGGVYYGAGTRFQREAGFDDNADEMFKYLQRELAGSVSDKTLRKFCDDSNENLQWLESHGVEFSSKCYEPRIFYPPEGYFLYYSGNERGRKYAKIAKPAPRAHRTVGEGWTGNVLWAALRRSVDKSAIRYKPQTTVRRLVTDRAGAVLGLEVLTLTADNAARHARRMRRFNKSLLRLTGGPIALAIGRNLRKIEATGTRQLLRARKAVVLAAGGYVYNREMAHHYAPYQGKCLPMGTLSDSGDGVRLGQTAGGRAKGLDSFDISRGIVPIPYLSGIIVNSKGERFIAEDSYQATVGHAIAVEQNGKAWIVVDKQTRREAIKALEWPTYMVAFLFQLRIVASMLFGTKKASKFRELARKAGIDPDGLERSIAEYQASCDRGEDTVGKNPAWMRHFGAGPYYAIDVGQFTIVNPTTGFSLGGLDVSEETGQVLDDSGSPIAGLYAAGRTAFGIPSKFYVSGLSIADCIFSGRRAGRSIAEQNALTSLGSEPEGLPASAIR